MTMSDIVTIQCTRNEFGAIKDLVARQRASTYASYVRVMNIRSLRAVPERLLDDGDADDDPVTFNATRDEVRAIADLIDRELDLEKAKPPAPPGTCDIFAGIREEGLRKGAELRDRLRAA